MVKTYETPEKARQDQLYLEALKELIYQLADDDLMISQRGSEWLGLAPHIEADVAFSSITQDTMGHAAMYYQMLEELGIGKADDLAHLRESSEYRCALLTERTNGEGDYMENPNYDWGYAIIRNYAYEVFKRIRLNALEQSSYAPLADTAKKIKREQFYHLYHWEVWIDQLANSTEEAERRLNAAILKTWEDVNSLFDLGPKTEQINLLGLIGPSETMKEAFLVQMKETLEKAGLIWPGEPQAVAQTGREGNHSSECVEALDHMNSVYKLDPQACW